MVALEGDSHHHVAVDSVVVLLEDLLLAVLHEETLVEEEEVGEVLQEDEVHLQDEEVDLDQVHQGLQLEVVKEVILLHVLDLQQERREEASRDLQAEADQGHIAVVRDQDPSKQFEKEQLGRILVCSLEWLFVTNCFFQNSMFSYL